MRFLSQSQRTTAINRRMYLRGSKRAPVIPHEGLNAHTEDSPDLLIPTVGALRVSNPLANRPGYIDA